MQLKNQHVQHSEFSSGQHPADDLWDIPSESRMTRQRRVGHWCHCELQLYQYSQEATVAHPQRAHRPLQLSSDSVHGVTSWLLHYTSINCQPDTLAKVDDLMTRSSDNDKYRWLPTSLADAKTTTISQYRLLIYTDVSSHQNFQFRFRKFSLYDFNKCQ